MTTATHRIRVRYAETDQMAVAHHAAYVAWLEEARIAWMRAHGHSYRDLETAGTLMPVIELRIAYRRPARFDDELELTTTARALGPSRIAFTTRIARGPDTVAEAEVTVAATDRSGKPVRIPDGMKALLG
jgi:acyl-CoA thioester hydrolase